MIANDRKTPRTNYPNLLTRLGAILKERFSLEEDKEDERAIIQTISRGIEFRGVNLWTLICAIFIASVSIPVGAIDGETSGHGHEPGRLFQYP